MADGVLTVSQHRCTAFSGGWLRCTLPHTVQIWHATFVPLVCAPMTTDNVQDAHRNYSMVAGTPPARRVCSDGLVVQCLNGGNWQVTAGTLHAVSATHAGWCPGIGPGVQRDETKSSCVQHRTT